MWNAFSVYRTLYTLPSTNGYSIIGWFFPPLSFKGIHMQFYICYKHFYENFQQYLSRCQYSLQVAIASQIMCLSHAHKPTPRLYMSANIWFELFEQRNLWTSALRRICALVICVFPEWWGRGGFLQTTQTHSALRIIPNDSWNSRNAESAVGRVGNFARIISIVRVGSILVWARASARGKHTPPPREFDKARRCACDVLRGAWSCTAANTICQFVIVARRKFCARPRSHKHPVVVAPRAPYAMWVCRFLYTLAASPLLPNKRKKDIARARRRIGCQSQPNHRIDIIYAFRTWHVCDGIFGFGRNRNQPLWVMGNKYEYVSVSLCVCKYIQSTFKPVECVYLYICLYHRRPILVVISVRAFPNTARYLQLDVYIVIECWTERNCWFEW